MNSTTTTEADRLLAELKAAVQIERDSIAEDIRTRPADETAGLRVTLPRLDKQLASFATGKVLITDGTAFTGRFSDHVARLEALGLVERADD